MLYIISDTLSYLLESLEIRDRKISEFADSPTRFVPFSVIQSLQEELKFKNCQLQDLRKKKLIKLACQAQIDSEKKISSLENRIVQLRQDINFVEESNCEIAQRIFQMTFECKPLKEQYEEYTNRIQDLENDISIMTETLTQRKKKEASLLKESTRLMYINKTLTHRLSFLRQKLQESSSTSSPIYFKSFIPFAEDIDQISETKYSDINLTNPYYNAIMKFATGVTRLFSYGDSSVLIAGSNGGHARAGMKKPYKTIFSNKSSIVSICATQSENVIQIGTRNGSIFFYDSDFNEKFKISDRSPLACSTFLSELLFASHEQKSYFYDVNAQRDISTYKKYSTANTALSTDQYVVCGHHDNYLRIWSPSAPNPVFSVELHLTPILGIASVSDHQFLTIAEDKTMVLSDIRNEANRKIFHLSKYGNFSPSRAMQFCVISNNAIIGGNDSSIHFINIYNNNSKSIKAAGGLSFQTVIPYSLGLASGDSKGFVMLWNWMQ